MARHLVGKIEVKMNRRELIKTALYGGAAAALSGPIGPQFALGAAPEQSTPARSTQTLRIVQRTIDVKGRAAKVFGLLQPDGTHGLSFAAGESFDVSLRNETTEPTTIHWHGLTPPWEQDGVIDAPLPLIAPQANRTFRFPVGAAGTHWMHAHTLQEQALMAAPLIVNDSSERGRDEQDVVILLHDFSFLSAEELLARLRGTSGHGAMGPMGGMDHSRMGRGTPGMMPMTMDLNDINYDAYLANDRTLDDPQVVKVETGGRVRLRIINGAAATAFTIDLGALDGELFAVDGQDIMPVSGRRFPIAMGQRLDIRLELPATNEAFPVLALREGAREMTGIILAPVKAAVRKLTSEGNVAGPAIGLQLEQKLSAVKPLTTKRPDRRFDVTLMGGMGGYAWGIDARPKLTVRNGERAEISMLNMSMMAHPMHLHGHHFQVVAIDDRRFSGAMRDTVHIPPHRSVTVAFDASNPGDWAFHCHHLYHMVAGMMSSVNYENSKRKQT
jgi:FtsP/CotA-like multicopper oxidase with cupredoxin domain